MHLVDSSGVSVPLALMTTEKYDDFPMYSTNCLQNFWEYHAQIHLSVAKYMGDVIMPQYSFTFLLVNPKPGRKNRIFKFSVPTAGLFGYQSIANDASPMEIISL